MDDFLYAAHIAQIENATYKEAIKLYYVYFSKRKRARVPEQISYYQKLQDMALAKFYERKT